jgi:2-dehydropantoate 2-reductase
MHFREQIPVSASTEARAAHTAEVVLFCVKSLDTEDAARSLAPHLAPGAVVTSLQNGVDNVERIRSATGIEAIPAVVYVAAEMVAAGHLKHNGRGDLKIGDLLGRGRHRGQVDGLVALFTRAGIPCQASAGIEADLWTKMMMNCAYNAISALGQSRYGRLVADPRTREVMRQVVQEGVAVARAAGIQLAEAELLEATYRLGEAMSNALSSTAQDLARGKRTEIDSLNGYVACRGKELGIATPVNAALHALVKLLEETAVTEASCRP